MSYLDTKRDQYYDLLKLVDKKISKGKGIKSFRKSLVKKINQLEYLIDNK
jgi:hypothetical protein